MKEAPSLPIQVLVVGSKFPPEYAGSGVAVHGTYRRLADSGYPVEWKVITNSIEFPWNENYNYDGVSVKRISSKAFRNWDKVPSKILSRLLFAAKTYMEAFATWRALLQMKADVIHVFGMAAAPAAAIWWARFWKIPLIVELVTSQASPFQGFPGLHYCSWLKMDNQTAIIAISEALGNACAKRGLRDNVWVRGNTVESDRFVPAFSEKKKLRKDNCPFEDEDIILSMVAKFMPQKNQIFLLDVLAALPERYKLILAGPMVTQGRLLERDQAYVEAIHQKISHLKLEKRVLLITDFVDSATYMKLSDVYMMPNTNEGLGTPMLEAIACGIPVVANAEESPFQQWIKNNQNGYLCPMKVQDWVAAIKKASVLSERQMIEESKKILSCVGSRRLDEGFFSLLKTMQLAKPHEKISIKQVLSTAENGHLS